MSQQLQTMWHYLNSRYFDGRLLPIEIAWSARLTSSTGMFISQSGPRHPQQEQRQRVIRLSRPLLSGLPESETLITLAHEMIHQWQFDVLKRHANHGKDFQRKMAEMNRAGLDITVHHSLDHAVQALCKYTWCCTRCGRTYRRQRRTIRPRRHRCGDCSGPLQEIKRDAVPQLHRLSRGIPDGSRPTRKHHPLPTLERTSPIQLALKFSG